MFGYYTIPKTSNSNYQVYNMSASNVKNSSVKTTSPSKKIENKKEELEKLKEKLAKEQEELERTLQETLDAQNDILYNGFEDNYIEDYLTQQLNLAYIKTYSNYQKGHRYSNVKGSFDTASVNFHQNDNGISFPSFENQGLKYSSKNGEKFAKTIAANSVGFTGHCSKYVSDALAESGMGKERAGSAYQMGGKLANNKNFQEVTSEFVDLKNLPAGCILVYDKGAAGYNSTHGHIEVTLGDGRACSDGVTRNLRSTQNMRVFVPVEKA